MTFVVALVLVVAAPVLLALGIERLLVTVELQVHAGGEPYLHKKHGESYASYCRSVGRFLPRLR